jgi:general secretion pathway protein D
MPGNRCATRRGLPGPALGVGADQGLRDRVRPAAIVSAVLAGVMVLAAAGGCARLVRPETKRAQAQPETPAPAPAPAAPAAPAPPPAPTAPPPPVSIGPRPEVAPPALPPPPRETPPGAPAPGAQRGRFIVLNFDNADIETVVHAASEIVGFNYVLAPDVRGKVTVQTSGRIPQEDVFGVLLAILEVHGFTAVKSGNLYKIVRIEGARERAVPTFIGGEVDPTRPGDEVITQILPVRFTSVADLSTLLRPLISARGSVIAHRETNVLIVTDTASNLKRLLDIVRVVDVQVTLDELVIIPIRFADAADLATILNQLFQSGRVSRGAAPTPGAPPPPPVTPVVPGQPPAPPPPGPAGQTTGAADRTPLIIAERRSNSLIIHARRPELETLRRLINQLDVNIYGGRRVFVYYAENAKARDLAATLNAIYGGKETVPTTPSPTAPARPGQPPPPPPPPPAAAPGGPIGGVGTLGDLGVIEGQVRFIADETTNAIIVTTFPRSWPEIEATIKQLDRMPRQVLIEVLVVEVTLTDDLRLGLDWALKEGSFRLANQNINTSPTAVGSITSPSRRIPMPDVPLVGLPGPGLTAFAFQTDKFFAIINTLASENKLNVISNPHVLTSENKKAVINVSDSVPIVTSQQVPFGGTVTGTATPTSTTASVVGTQTVEYRDAGVILTVTPRIGERGTVALDVKQEVNDFGGPEPPTSSRRIIKREAETSVVLVNNQTLVLGGLIKERRNLEDRGIPFLKNIPVLGYLFGAKVATTTKTELLLLITPRVIGTAADAARITDEMRRLTPELERSIRQAPRPPVTAPPPVEPAEPELLSPPDPPRGSP